MNAEQLAIQAMEGPVVDDIKPVQFEKSSRPAWMTPDMLKGVARSRWFRYFLLFVVICVLLCIIAPPFVQQRRKNQSSLEKAPTSYKRVLITATVVTGLVVVSPLAISHKDKFVSAFGVVKKWF